MRSESHTSPMKAMFLAILMVMMVQTGYMDIWNNSISNDSSLDETSPNQSGGGGNSLIASSDGVDLMLGEVMENITFQYNASAASGSGSGSGASQSSFVNNIGLRTTSGSATQSTNGAAITPIEFSLEWDNFTTPSSLSSSETAMFPFDHSVNDTTSTPVENSTLSASNLTYDRHGREMHALDETVIYEHNLSELAISSNRISLSLWIKPTNVGTEQSIIDNHPQYHLRMNADGSLNFRIRQTSLGAWNDHASSIQLEDDTWYHIGVSASTGGGFVVNFYVNGSLDVQRTTSSSYGFTSSTGTELDLMGPSSNFNAFEGILDDLYLYDAVLSASDFSTLMDVGEITWDVSPSLPAGLSLDTFTGTITGTPSTPVIGQYTVYANSSSASYSRTFNLNLNSGNGSGSGMTNVTGATCSVSPALPTGLSIDSSTCTISGTPSVATSNTTYTITADINGTIYQGTVWFSTGYGTLYPSVEGAELNVGTMMTDITFQYDGTLSSGSGNGSGSGGSGSGSNSSSSNNTTASLVIGGNVYGLTQSVGNGNTLYFYGYDATNGYELWKSDGTTSGTVMVKDINPSGSSNPKNFVVLGNTVYFSADDGTNGTELWKTDGTASGTVMVKDIHPSGSSSPSDITAWGNSLYFQANNGANGIELWKSDGTASGTTMVKDIYSGSSGSAPPNGGLYDLTEMGNELFFRADDGTNGLELWVTDGTASGTSMVKDIYSSGSSTPGCLTTLGNTIYFKAYNSTSGTELWKSDGTSSGTAMVKEIRSGTANPFSYSCTFLGVGNTLYFQAQDGTNGLELWKSDGTASGTVMVKDINIYGSADIHFLVEAGNKFFFSANDYFNGSELWKSDGTASGTVMVKNIQPGNGGSSPSYPVVVGNTLYFDADIGGNVGNALWKSDGTDAGTVMIQDFDLPGRSGPKNLIHVGNNLFFSAYNGSDWGIYVLNTGSGSSSGSGPARMLVTNATCSISPALPTGLSLTQGTCAIKGTPFLGMANTTFTVTAVIENVTYVGDFWLNISGPLDPPMPLIAVNNTAIIDYEPYFDVDGATYEISPDLPGDLVLNPTTGVISGTPRETLANTTFTVWANSSSENRTWNFTLEILEDTDGDGDPDQLPDDYDPGVSAPPMLTEDLDDDGDGISDLEEDADGTDPLNPDTDGDGMCDGAVAVDPHCVAGPDAFPTDPSADTDTDGDGNPDTITGNSTTGLIEDLDDDGDGVEDVNETDTGIYVDETDTGTNPLNPDSDFDGTCDGPVDVYHPQTGDLICVAGPDTELGNLPYGTHYGLNGSAIQSISPEWRPAGAVWTISPDLPADLTIDPVSGLISGIPSEVTGNVTYTISGVGTSGTYSSQFNLQILEDTDRDGEANELPADYDNTTVTPMVEDLDDDGDGLSDLVETGTGFYNGTGDYGTDPLNPDTDGDGVCDGPNSVWPICINGPDSNPFGTHDASNIVLVENMAITTPIPPPNQVPGAVWEISPALPEGLTLNTSSGIITGTPTEVRDNETYTLWANVSDFGRSDSVALSVMATFGLTVLADTDGDGMPDELPDDYDENIGILVEDDDDDNDGMLDTEEATEGTDPLDPDTDGDGFCDGPADVYSSSGELICRGPDPAPLDANEPLDTDGDMFPDEDPDGEGGLVADSDDDNDGFLDTLETSCGSSTVDATDTPQDFDGDTICDLMDPDMDGDGLDNTVETDTGTFISSADTGTNSLNPDTDGDGYCDGPVSPNYSNCTAGPDAFPTDASAHLDTDGDGNPDTITGNSTTGLIEDLDDDGDGASDIAELDCGTDPLDATDVAETDADGNCVKKSADPESLFEWSWSWCFCLIFLLLLLLLIPIVMQRDRILLMLSDGPEPENTTSLPEFISGAGTIDDPFILAPAEGVKPGESVSSTEVITIDKMSDIRVDMIDLNQEDNGNKFAMYETSFDEIGVRLVAVGSDGQITINFIFDDGEGEESYAGGEFTGLMKLGRASVYFSWTVTVTPDKAKMREIEKAEKEAKKAEEKAAKEAKKAEEKAAKEAEAKAKKEAKEAEAAAKKAEEEAAALLAEEEASAAAAAALAAKEEEEKAAKEAEAKAKKEAEAEAAALAAKEEEEAAAKKKAEEEAAAKKKAEEEAAAKKKAEEEAAAAAAAAKPANKEEKKKAELKRVKERSKSIDFKVLGTAKASEKDDLQVIKGVGPFIEEKLNALGIYTYKQISKMTSKLEDTVNEAIEFFPGRVKRDQWVAQAKILLGEDVKLDEKALKQAEELARVAAKAESIDFATIGVASASDRDNLQELKGIGPFIEEKLNALGIFKFEQIAKMTSEIEEEVNIAIEFFPGRVKRDEWVKQAKKLSKK